jgi:hypothetical protein
MKIADNYIGYVFNAKYADKVQRCQTANKRRFSRRIGTINWEKLMSIRLYVSYGLQVDYRGKKVQFDNEGIYTNKKDFMNAYRAFTEKGL